MYGDLGLPSQPEGSVFRVSLEGGGCTGFKYQFDITQKEDDDIVIDDNVVIDPMSMMYLKNSVLDFKKSVFAESFVVENPNVSSQCGCGESVNFF